MKKTQILIEFGKPNKNNRIYNKENFKDIPESVPLYCEPPFDITPMNKKIGNCNLTVRDDCLVGDIEVTDIKYIDLLQHFSVVPCGVGNLTTNENQEHIISNYEIKSVAFTDNPA